MFNVEGGGEDVSLGQRRTLDVPGIFDMRWLPSVGSPPTLALACADGTVSLVGCGQAGIARHDSVCVSQPDWLAR